MPRDSGGNYALPGGYLAVTGEPIVASQHNPPLEDLAAAMTSSLPRNGAAPMTGQLLALAGTAVAPGISFSAAPTYGLYKTTSGFGVAAGGSRVMEFLSGVASFVDGGDIASAAALTLGTGNVFNITGSAAITSIGTKNIGCVVWLRFNETLVLTHHATDLILTSGANISTRAGDWAQFEEYAAGDWRMLAYQRADGSALVSTSPRGYIDGCIISNSAGDATNDIDIAAGVCRDSTNSVDIIVPAITGKQLDANWAAGGAAGMRNSAAGITNTTYHLYAVRTAASATADIYAHTSAVAATALAALQLESGGSSYIYARRIGSIVRASNAILAFSQFGDHFLWLSPKSDVVNVSITTTAALKTLTVPLGIKVFAQLQISSSDADNDSIYISSPDVTNDAASLLVNASIYASTAGPQYIAEISVRTDTSSQVRTRSTGAMNLWLNTKGYVDTRGKDI